MKFKNCTYCGEINFATRDHFYPKSKGGKTVVWSCYPCNCHKGNLLPFDWIEKVKEDSNFSLEKKERIIKAVQKLVQKIPIEFSDLGFKLTQALKSKIIWTEKN